MKQHQISRIFGLDILRSIAILLVVFTHSMWVLYPSVPVGSIGDILFVFASMIGGFFGVELFFILSGFLIGGIFIRELVYEQQQPKSLSRQVSRFWIKRWFRTLPNYYLFVLLYLFVAWFIKSPDLKQFSWKYLCFIQNFSHSGPGFFYVAWSLSVEEWFYLMLPTVFVLTFFFSNSKILAFKCTTFLLFVIPFGLRIAYVVLHPHSGQFSQEFNLTTMYRLDSIAYGVVLAWLWQNKAIKDYLLLCKSKLLWAGLLAFIAVLYYIFFFVAKPQQNGCLVLLSYPWASLSILMCFPYMISLTATGPSFFQQGVGFVSRISYSLYLVHPLLAMLVDFYVKKRHVSYTLGLGLFCFTLILCASMALAQLSYKYCEQPFLNLRERFLLKMNR